MILALCGTSEGRALVEKLLEKKLEVIATVTTAYGGQLLKEDSRAEVLEEKLDVAKMRELIEEKNIQQVIDITHPYAENISRLAMEVCREKELSYFRYERPETQWQEKENNHLYWAKDFSHAATMAKNFEGKIFLTIGSNQLPIFVETIEVKRLVARVLPLSSVIRSCETYGFTPDNLIAMKGPFNKELNKQMFKSYGANVVITKDSGKAGGTEEKILAAQELNIPIILVKKPTISYGEVDDDIDVLVNKIASIYSK
ncbi:cobalt-precorrin-6A reductase [Clostridium formicaceticum]|uniref:Precorrin-6A reductase n=1 Tax=Clostridium formicaceticum TaxID=1497 RepID=A0AAC9WEM0_9CLOT|nr:cobalt-precorrin-6A reductase [Clostridium formicaceticum]AOY75469.1 precorrin-6x reductase [Clostridium formicaceticum]ARE85754.1 Precorrin-6A reductase [Clostridium formicaceticum]